MEIGGTPVALYDSSTGGFTNTNIPFYTDSGTLQTALRHIAGLEYTEVYSSTNDFSYGALWIISFLRANTDIPDMVLSGAQLAGGKVGTSPEISFF